MLGLRPDSDQYHLHSIRSSGAFRRSSKFADRLNGRFFVSGISGGFQKHSKQLLELANKDKPVVKSIKYCYQPVLEKHQREELRKDAERLMELEEKLQELQRVKEAKRQRDRNRRKRKLEFNSAFTIQKAFRNYQSRKFGRAIDIIRNYLRSIQAKNAICTAVWAIHVLRKFAKRASNMWFQMRTCPKIIRKVANDNWLLVVDIASIMTAARREVADNMVHNIMTVATQNVSEVLTAHAAKKIKRNRTQRNTNDFLQFFLTEFDREDEGEDDDSIQSFSDDESKDKSNLNSTKLSKRKSATDLLNKPLLKQTSRYLAQRPEEAIKPKKGKQYNPNDEQTRKLIRKHQDLIIQTQEEQKRRLMVVEKLKQRVEEEKILKKFYEDEEKLAKQKQKEDFQKKLEAEIAQRKKLALKLQEEKKKSTERKLEEQNREKQELRSMYREDIRLQTLVLRPPKPVQKKKIEVFKKPVEIDHAEIEKQLEKEKALQLQRQKARQRLIERKQEQAQLEREEKVRKLREKEELQQRKKELLAQANQQPWKVKRKKSAKKESRPDSTKEKKNGEQDDDDFLNELLSDNDSDENPLSDDSLDQSRHRIRSHREEYVNLIDTDDVDQENDDIDHEENDHVISSAREQFDNLLDDFAFDDFIERSLLQIYSAPPTQLATNAGRTAVGGESFPISENNDNHEDQNHGVANNQGVKVKKLKIPDFLKNTPYYASYSRQVKKNKSDSNVTDHVVHTQQHQPRVKPIVHEKPKIKPNNKVAPHKIVEKEESENNDEEYDVPIEENETLLSLLQRAKVKLMDSMQAQDPKKKAQYDDQKQKKENTMEENHQSPEKKSPTSEFPVDIYPYPEQLKIPSSDPHSFQNILPSAPTFSHMLQNKAPPSLPLPPTTLDGIRNRYGLPSDPTVYDNPFLMQKFSSNKKKALPSLKKTASSPAESFAKDNKQPPSEGINAKTKMKSKSTDKLEHVSKPKKLMTKANEALGKDTAKISNEERPRSGSKVVSKIHEYQDYEEKLQADYLTLRQQFTEKLNNQLINSSNNPLAVGESQQESKASDANNGLRNSITATYAAESNPKISTKDLLMEWAMEDALEQQGGDGVELGGDGDEEDYDCFGEEGGEEEERDNEAQPSIAFNAQNLMRDLDIVYEDDEENYQNGSHLHENEHGHEEEEDDNEEYDEREYMKNERNDYWKQLVNNDDALDAQCLSLMQNLGNKLKK